LTQEDKEQFEHQELFDQALKNKDVEHQELFDQALQNKNVEQC
jgi:hypothetical protein